MKIIVVFYRLMEYYKITYYAMVGMSYLLVLASFFGVWKYAPKYTSILSLGIQLYVAVYLVYISFKTKDSFDKRVLRESALLIFLSSALAEYLRPKVTALLPFHSLSLSSTPAPATGV